MLKDMGLSGVLFTLVPGFIADLAYRSLWGLPKGDEYDRTLRSIVWSVLGLMAFFALFNAPPSYLGTAPTTLDLVTSSHLAADFAKHIGLCVLIASVFGLLFTASASKWVAERTVRRDLARTPVWETLWSEDALGKTVSVRDRSGTTFTGRLRAASSGDAPRELVLQNVAATRSGGVRQSSKFIFLPGSEIVEVNVEATESGPQHV